MTETNNFATDTTTENTTKKNAFSFLYRTRIKVNKDETPIMNLSFLFCVISLLCAPWLVIGGLIAALTLGYRFSYEREAKGFCGDFQEVVRDAAGNVKSAVDSITNDAE